MKITKSAGHWLYFAYGANLNMEQMNLSCTSPKPIAIARLPNHRIEFFGHSTKWDGALETCLVARHRDLWGVVYELSLRDGDRLDSCQDVRLDGNGAYFHYPAEVVDDHGNIYDVRLYKKDVLGIPRRPSREYLDHIVQGAMFHGLPADYLESLRAIASKAASYRVPRADRYDLAIVTGGECSECGE
jgi:hypothetical protein